MGGTAVVFYRRLVERRFSSKTWHVHDTHLLLRLRFSGHSTAKFPGCRLPKAILLRSSTPGKAERAGTWVGASRDVAQTQLFGAAPRIWRSVEPFRGRSWPHVACWVVVVHRSRSACRERRRPRPQAFDPAEDLGGQGARHRYLGQLKRGVVSWRTIPWSILIGFSRRVALPGGQMFFSFDRANCRFCEGFRMPAGATRRSAEGRRRKASREDAMGALSLVIAGHQCCTGYHPCGAPPCPGRTTLADPFRPLISSARWLS